MSADFGTENIPENLPVLPLFDAVLFPKMVLPLVVIEDDSVKLVDEAMSKDRIIGLLVSKKRSKDKSNPEEDLAVIGTSAMILKMAKTEDNKAQLLVQGLARFEVKNFSQKTPYLRADIEDIHDEGDSGKEVEAMKTNIISLFNRIVELSPGLPKEIATMSNSIEESGILADMVASTINSPTEEKQKILETANVKNRLKEVTRQLNQQLDILELGNKIQSQVKGDMDKTQREYYLRKQLKAIKEELGEGDEEKVEIDEYRTKIDDADLPEEAKTKRIAS